MTSLAAIIALLSTVISLVGFWFLLFILYRDFRVDNFRQEMFKLRDELFDFTASGNIKFNDPIYNLLRQAFNGYIRFAHKLSLLQMLIFIFLGNKLNIVPSSDTFSQKWNELIKTYGPEATKKFENYRLRMNILVIKHVLLSSPVLMTTIIIPIISFILMKYAIRRFVEFLSKPLDDIDSAALAFGSR